MILVVNTFRITNKRNAEVSKDASAFFGVNRKLLVDWLGRIKESFGQTNLLMISYLNIDTKFLVWIRIFAENNNFFYQ